jgi:hypothetical protein
MGLAGAMETYRTYYGEYPPSRAEDMRAHLDRLFPRRDRTEPVPDPDPAELLVFWLQGYSPDPRRPLTGTGGRVPLFDFDKARLIDIDRDGWPEYLPRYLNGSRAPYVYFSKPYEGQSYSHPTFRGTATPLPKVTKSFQIVTAGPDGDFGGPGSKRHRAERDNLNLWPAE